MDVCSYRPSISAGIPGASSLAARRKMDWPDFVENRAEDLSAQ